MHSRLVQDPERMSKEADIVSGSIEQIRKVFSEQQKGGSKASESETGTGTSVGLLDALGASVADLVGALESLVGESFPASHLLGHVQECLDSRGIDREGLQLIHNDDDESRKIKVKTGLGSAYLWIRIADHNWFDVTGVTQGEEAELPIVGIEGDKFELTVPPILKGPGVAQEYVKELSISREAFEKLGSTQQGFLTRIGNATLDALVRSGRDPKKLRVEAEPQSISGISPPQYRILDDNKVIAIIDMELDARNLDFKVTIKSHDEEMLNKIKIPSP